MGFRVAGVPFKRFAVEGAAISAATAAIAAAEVAVVQYVIDPYTLRVGTSFLIEAMCDQAGANAARCVPAVRCGPTTLTGPFVAGFAIGGAVGTGAVPSFFKCLCTVRSIGAAGTMYGSIQQLKDGVQIEDECAGAAVAVDTTVRNILEFTFASGNAANTYTFRSAHISKVVA